MVSMNFISICGSVTLVMHSDVPAVRTRGCQHSNQEKRSCWTRRRWRMLETLHFTHPTAHASKPHIPFFSFHPWRHDCLCKNTEMKAAFSVYMRWGVCACFVCSVRWPLFDGFSVWNHNTHHFVSAVMQVMFAINLRVWQCGFGNEQEWDLNEVKKHALIVTAVFSCCC